ncbi:MAG: universal stress protein [Mariprofundales bacterium]|nr:universal stress protein [Mariprofundales bacterium]
MRPIHHILVPTDFSASATQAVNTAAELAQRFDADLTLLHIVAPQYYLPDMVPPTMPMMTDMTAVLEEAANSRLTELQASLNSKLQQITGEVKISTLKPADAICQFTDQNAIDLIVIGCHGRTGLMHLLMGSTAEHVVRYASCPVLITKLEQKVKPKPE